MAELSPLSETSNIVLCTLNAKYIHASLGLRYLLANMGDLQAQTALCEFTISRKTEELAAELLALNPQIIGFGVYIWNTDQTYALIKLLKAQHPSIKIVLGGPEVSHETLEQDIVALCDHVITGWGDVSFPKLCRALIHGPQPLMKVIAGEQPSLDAIKLPYDLYTDDDLAHRLLYVEASRGCPFKCEFCLSSLDKTAWAFDLDAFLAELTKLYARGARNFKFVDRTFNLKIDASVRLLQFFLDRLNDPLGGDLFVHFEVIPDHLPDKLKDMIAQFPPGVLQFEVGIQSFNVEVQQRISRRQDNDKTVANLAWLVNESNAHLHTDLIFGLPGESLESFGQGFDRLFALKPHEIQLGILKRLRGTPIARHTEAHGMVYDPLPPYQVQQTKAVSADDMQRFVRLARYWDLVANSGRFGQTMDALLKAESPLQAFMDFSDWLWQTSQKTSGVTPEALVDALYAYLTTQRQLPTQPVQSMLLSDYLASGARGYPQVLKGILPHRPPLEKRSHMGAARQSQHLATAQTQTDKIAA